jgi:hypothetical protein
MVRSSLGWWSWDRPCVKDGRVLQWLGATGPSGRPLRLGAYKGWGRRGGGGCGAAAKWHDEAASPRRACLQPGFRSGALRAHAARTAILALPRAAAGPRQGTPSLPSPPRSPPALAQFGGRDARVRAAAAVWRDVIVMSPTLIIIMPPRTR